MIPITRKELYLNKIVGNNDYEIPEKPITTEEFFFAEILGEAVPAPEPLTRYQMYLAKIAGRNIEIPYPEVRLEYFLARAAGMEIEAPTPITREEMFWADYALIVEKELSGIPPLTFNAVAGTLKNYRIYGDTVDGESVGDRTGNLFDMSSVYAIGYIDDSGNIVVAQGYAITTYDFIPIDQSSSYSIKICGKLNINTSQRKIRVAFYDRDQIFISRIGLGEASNVRTFNAINNSHYIRISIDDGNTNIMLNEGSTALPYEPYGYKVPVTVSNGTDTQTIPIYLPEQIKKVGDEAEYIDYAEQKLHRVRKNLLKNTMTSQTINGVTFTGNSDGSITCNGTASAITYLNLNENFNSTLYAGMKASFYQSGQQASANTFLIRISKANRVGLQDFQMNNQVIIDNGDSLLLAIRINTGYTCNNLTFYPMIRKADIEDDTYEPYIENTDLDVTLPALPTLAGTNVLSVGTAVQPSKVYVKYKGERQ